MELINKSVIVGGTICGILLFIATNLQQYGITHTSAGKAGFITSLYIYDTIPYTEDTLHIFCRSYIYFQLLQFPYPSLPYILWLSKEAWAMFQYG